MAVESDNGHGLTQTAAGQADAAEIGFPTGLVHGRDGEGRGLCAGAGLQGADVEDAVEGQVGAEDLEDDALRFARLHQAVRAGEAAEMNGVGADIGAHFHDIVIGLHDLGEEFGLGLGLAILAIEREGAADVAVGAQEQELAVAAGLLDGERGRPAAGIAQD